MRIRKKPNLAARMEKCRHLLISDPETLRGRWLNEFGYSELHIELGCGKGRFTVDTAKADPYVLIVALEKSADAMITALERAAAESLQNVRFLNVLVDNIADYFAPGEVSRIYLNFCDPWPSNRHVNRRLTSRLFLDLYSRTLRPDGELLFKTDNLPLFKFSLREFERAGFEILEVEYDLHKDGAAGVMTDYEIKFHNQGMPIYKCSIRKGNERKDYLCLS